MRIDHGLGFAEFLAGNADGTCAELHMGDFRDFVRFGVDAQRDVVLLAYLGCFPDVFFENVEVNGKGRCVEGMDGHWHTWG